MRRNKLKCEVCRRGLEPGEPVYVYWATGVVTACQGCMTERWGKYAEMATLWAKRECRGCGRPVVQQVTVRRAEAYCSPHCRQKRTPVEHATVKCARCGKPFTQARTDAKFCSVRCRVAGWRSVEGASSRAPGKRIVRNKPLREPKRAKPVAPPEKAKLKFNGETWCIKSPVTASGYHFDGEKVPKAGPHGSDIFLYHVVDKDHTTIYGTFKLHTTAYGTFKQMLPTATSPNLKDWWVLDQNGEKVGPTYKTMAQADVVAEKLKMALIEELTKGK